ncbi:MAG: hypothetical protein MHPSP_003846 [Paramarteilia canceri]
MTGEQEFSAAPEWRLNLVFKNSSITKFIASLDTNFHDDLLETFAEWFNIERVENSDVIKELIVEGALNLINVELDFDEDLDNLSKAILYCQTHFKPEIFKDYVENNLLNGQLQITFDELTESAVDSHEKTYKRKTQEREQVSSNIKKNFDNIDFGEERCKDVNTSSILAAIDLSNQYKKSKHTNSNSHTGPEKDLK